MMDSQHVVRDITQARVDGANIVVVLPHWGTKNRAQTPDTVQTMAREMAQAGADVIFGTHPNVAQGIERLQTVRSDGLTYETVVCYSLGCLLTDARDSENTAGMAVRLEMTMIRRPDAPRPERWKSCRSISPDRGRTAALSTVWWMRKTNRRFKA